MRESSSSEGRSGGGVRGLWSSYEEAAPAHDCGQEGGELGRGRGRQGRPGGEGGGPFCRRAASGAAHSGKQREPSDARVWMQAPDARLCCLPAEPGPARQARGSCTRAVRWHLRCARRTCCCGGAAARLHIQLRRRGGPQLLEAVQVSHIGRSWGACSRTVHHKRWTCQRYVGRQLQGGRCPTSTLSAARTVVRHVWRGTVGMGLPGQIEGRAGAGWATLLPPPPPLLLPPPSSPPVNATSITLCSPCTAATICCRCCLPARALLRR